MLKPQIDIVTVDDVEALVHSFYELAINDALVGHFFTEVVVLDFEIHLPKIVRFWSSILLGTHDYKGNPMIKHIELHRKMKLDKIHFDRWILLWHISIDEKYDGPIATLAKTKAQQIGLLMLHKVQQSETM